MAELAWAEETDLLRHLVRHGWVMYAFGQRTQPDALAAVKKAETHADVLVLWGYERASGLPDARDERAAQGRVRHLALPREGGADDSRGTAAGVRLRAELPNAIRVPDTEAMGVRRVDNRSNRLAGTRAFSHPRPNILYPPTPRPKARVQG